ncbi:MAG: PQQ-binding-like beta-propeller repeat protein [Armatimonadota bacterium]|nr:PQQ-binding-like beta-propeller repeat protein [Armatimonadota bacterium]
MIRVAFILMGSVASLSAMAQVGPWPMEGQDRWGTGRALAGPDPGTQLSPWIKYRVVGELVSHGPAIGAQGLGYFGSWIPSQVSKFSLATGSALGSFDTLGNFVQSTPAIGADGQVYLAVAANYSNSPPGRVFSIDPATMDYDWVFTTSAVKVNDWDSASPRIGPDGDVVISSTTGHAWRLNETNGQPVWTKPGLEAAYHTMAFSRNDAVVYVANGSNLTALNYSDGSLAWNFNAGSEAGAPSVAPDGTVMFGCDGGTVFALNPNGTIRWSWLTLAAVRAAPAFSSNGRAYVSGYDSRLYSFDVASGARIWSYTVAGSLRESPGVGFDGRIYVMTIGATLYCLMPDGSLSWSRVVPASEGRGPLSIGDDGTIYAAGSGIYAITQAISSQPPEAFALVRGTHVSGGLAEVLSSDNQYLRYKPGITFSPSQPPVELTFDTTCPRTQMVRLDLRLESGASTTNLYQQIYMRDYQTAQWVEVDARQTTTLDSVVELTLNQNLNRFIQPGTRTVRMRVTWKPNGPIFSIPWQVRIDEVRFALLPAYVYP